MSIIVLKKIADLTKSISTNRTYVWIAMDIKMGKDLGKFRCGKGLV